MSTTAIPVAEPPGSPATQSNIRPTDHRNLDLCQFNLDVAFGRANGAVIWQPRILCWFADREFSGTPLPERYQGMIQPEIYRDLGCSNRLYEFNSCFRMVDPPDVARSYEPVDDLRGLYKTVSPAGTMTAVYKGSHHTRCHFYEKRWIETPDDMVLATDLMDRSIWEWDQQRFDEVQAAWGDLGAPSVFIPRVNVQHLYIDMMGVEHAVYALGEWGSIVTDFFRALHENHLRLIEVINKSPIELINFGDNLHCATLSPRLYEKYVLPAYLDRCEHLHRGGKFVSSHWDGDTRSLLKFAKISGLDAIEAITPKPQGDVTLEEMKEALGDRVYLMDGIPAIYFDELFPEDELARCTERLIELFAPRLILGISEQISSTGHLERIRLVGQIVDDYNAGLSAPNK